MSDQISGQKIVEVRQMTDAEMDREYWGTSAHANPPVLVLEDGRLHSYSMRRIETLK